MPESLWNYMYFLNQYQILGDIGTKEIIYKWHIDFFSCCCLVAQLCLTLCNPMDYSPRGSSVHGISKARILEWVAISSPGDLPNPWIEPMPPVLQANSSPVSHQESPNEIILWLAYRLPFSQFSSVTQSCLTLCDPMIAALQASLSITNTQSSLKLMSIELVMPSSHLILCRPLLLLLPNPPSITVISNESTLHIRWPKYWSFSFSISPTNEHPGLISFRMDWLDLLAVQGTLKSPLQHHSSKASILRCSAFLTVQLSIHIWPLEKP